MVRRCTGLAHSHRGMATRPRLCYTGRIIGALEGAAPVREPVSPSAAVGDLHEE
ncbi:hypothetical protein AAW51_1877 [Caldimonas brevitalea]|uniref:Uncharacterized protein n=1 Tax=Caldimonas brevitalea TaxID=413882 RepID=A0A0G3BKQ3_9BURK|nr:hypothetical protein AAW51_1877 [Caldimonas brevitalea]